MKIVDYKKVIKDIKDFRNKSHAGKKILEKLEPKFQALDKDAGLSDIYNIVGMEFLWNYECALCGNLNKYAIMSDDEEDAICDKCATKGYFKLLKFKTNES